MKNQDNRDGASSYGAKFQKQRPEKSHVREKKADSLQANIQYDEYHFEQILNSIKAAVTPKDFFDCACLLSSLVQGMNNDQRRELIYNTNSYVKILRAVFENKKLVEGINFICETEREASNWEEIDLLNVERKKFVKTGISLAFFPVAVVAEALTDKNIEFIRWILTSSVKNISSESAGENSFAEICFKLESISWNHKFNYTNAYVVKLDDSFLFGSMKFARAASGISFLSLTINSTLATQLSLQAEKTNTDEFGLSKSMNSIFGATYRIEEGIRSYHTGLTGVAREHLENYSKCFIRGNEFHLLFFIKQVCSAFQYQENRAFREILLEKINNAESLRIKITKYANENLKAYQGVIGVERSEWSNKVFITSLRLLSVLSGISIAKDDTWKCATAIYEYVRWIEDVHSILNKYSLEDDWSLISGYVRQETAEVEWKSTFFTPLEQECNDKETEAGISRKLFDKIVRTILAMINTSGGVIIVGLVENPEAVVRDEYKTKIINKENKAFFDVDYELKKERKTLDSVRLQIFEALKKITEQSAEKFNGLVSFQPVLLRDGNMTSTVVKIAVKSSEKQFFNCKRENNTTWASLTMRAQGQTIDVDIRDYISGKNRRIGEWENGDEHGD